MLIKKNEMISIKRYISGLVLGIFMLVSSSCSDYLDINSDPNNPTAVSEPLLLTGVIVNFSYEVLAGYPTRVTTTWTQQLAYNAVRPHYGMYDIDENDVNNTWTYVSYTDVMQNCKVLVEQATANELYDYAAIGKIIWAWNMSIVTDLFGNVPFSQAWDPFNFPLPAYDSQEDIYTAIQDLLDEAISDIDRTDGLTTYEVGADDFVYAGDMASWRKLANLLKARFHMRLAYAPGYDAETQADLVLDALTESFASNADNATYAYLDEAGQENPWYQYAVDGKWSTSTQMSEFFVDRLSTTSDPRLYAMADYDANGEFSGHLNGAPADADVSPIGSYYSAADAEVIWASYPEVKFLAAEAYLIKDDLAAAQTEYSAGIQASFDELSAEITAKAADSDNASEHSTDIATYIASYSTLSANTGLAYGQILNQKYVALFMQFEVYNDWRRTKIPLLSAAEDPIITSMTEPATRFPYPSAELNYNAENVNAEGVPVGNGAVTGKVWWNSAPENCTLCN